MHVVVAMVPSVICAILARSDARLGTRRLARRSVAVASMLTLGVALLIMAAFALMVTQGSVDYVNWIAMIAIHATVFLLSLSFGSLGYLLSYRFFQRPAPEGRYGGEDPVTRLDESGNPYQPPST